MLAICSTLPSLKYFSENIFPFPNKAPLTLSREHALTQAQRKEVKTRMQSMAFTNDFDRRPESPLTHGKQQVMEQLIRILDCVFPLLFAEVGVPPPPPLRALQVLFSKMPPLVVQVLNDTPTRVCPIKKSFGHLRRFALMHMQVHSYTSSEASLRRSHLLAARDELVEYAKLAEKVSNNYVDRHLNCMQNLTCC